MVFSLSVFVTPVSEVRNVVPVTFSVIPVISSPMCGQSSKCTPFPPSVQHPARDVPSPSTFHTSAPASKAPACPLPHPGYDQGVGRAAGPPSCVLGVCLGWGLGQEARAEGSVRCVVGDGAVATSGMPGVQAVAAEVVRRTCPQEPRLPRQGWHTPRRTSLPRPSDTHTPLASSQPLHGETQFLVLV